MGLYDRERSAEFSCASIAFALDLSNLLKKTLYDKHLDTQLVRDQ
ncbi:hypothetical protein LEP1GSC013_1573 [Leptospira interrogans serovar Valbuzzi str. Duyster]|nr:hypothetical protein LEP1GSC013_1573 [Leptospira interrogans serovar Valbuzzi str. Duyster]ENO72495.1 hypothetical protein LEP1GSC012_3903 [Leptospira interrogans serovar Valbuzzi str. Valbuzzi]